MIRVESKRPFGYERRTEKALGGVDSRQDDPSAGCPAVADMPAGRRGKIQQRHRPELGHVAPDRSAAGGQKVIGVLRVYSSQPHRFSEDEVSFLQVIANLGSIALQNAQLYDELHRSIDALQPDEDGWHRIV